MVQIIHVSQELSRGQDGQQVTGGPGKHVQISSTYTTMTAMYRQERVTGMYRKEIIYDPDSHDFAMYLDGELVGFARTYQEAEVTLDQLVFELMSGQYFREAA